MFGLVVSLNFFKPKCRLNLIDACSPPVIPPKIHSQKRREVWQADDRMDGIIFIRNGHILCRPQ